MNLFVKNTFNKTSLATVVCPAPCWAAHSKVVKTCLQGLRSLRERLKSNLCLGDASSKLPEALVTGVPCSFPKVLILLNGWQFTLEKEFLNLRDFHSVFQNCELLFFTYLFTHH